MAKFFSLLFIPQEENNHRALMLHPSFLGIFIAIYLLNQSIISSLTMLKPGILGYSSEITVQKVLSQTNLQRQNAGLPALQYSQTLSQSATAKAQDMFANNYWSHNSPQGKTPWDFFKSAGYQYTVAGENLAKDFYDTDGLIKAWMNSPTHKDNIINSKYQEIGIAVVNGVLNGIKTTLVVQHFATPLYLQSSPQKSAQNQSHVDVVEPALEPILEKELDINTAQSLGTSAMASPLISPLLISKIIGSIIFGLIIIVLSIDSYITLKNGTHRLTGSSASHIGFIIIILMLLVFGQQGRIF
ncbi:MAG TPA: CAP domain-containing protein [Candidatus Methanoperedens sp.]|nr:CAP domain-containing protein [Candidatus Methanoperedens sp.]